MTGVWIPTGSEMMRGRPHSDLSPSGEGVKWVVWA